MTRADRIHAALTERFHPRTLRVIDESAQHAGHAGAAPGGETHFRVIVESAAFDGLGLVDMHRAVYDALRDELATGLHALAIEARGTAG